MLDIQLLRNELDSVAERLMTRGYELHTARFEQLEGERKTIQTRTQELQAKRNSSSKLIGQAKAKGEDTSAIMAEVANLGDELKQLETRLGEVQHELNAFLAVIPNTPHESVPLGKSEADNLEVRRVGTPPQFDFEAQDHVSIGEGLGGLDFDTAAKISGARFSLLKGALGAAAPRVGAVHARYAYRPAWLHRDLCAVHRQRRFDARHRAVAEVRGRFVLCQIRVGNCVKRSNGLPKS